MRYDVYHNDSSWQDLLMQLNSELLADEFYAQSWTLSQLCQLSCQRNLWDCICKLSYLRFRNCRPGLLNADNFPISLKKFRLYKTGRETMRGTFPKNIKEIDIEIIINGFNIDIVFLIILLTNIDNIDNVYIYIYYI